MSIVFFLFSVMAVLVALHPYVSYPISLYILSRLRSQPSGSASSNRNPIALCSQQPRLAILMCVYNEERDIRQKVDDLLLHCESLNNTQILIYSDGSTDSTVDVLQKYADQITILASSKRRGKTHGMNSLVELADAEILVFTDAAVRMGEHAMNNLLSYFKDPAIGCVCARITAYDQDAETLAGRNTTSTADISVKSWAFDAAIRRLETRVASVIGAHGPLFAIRRELHKAVPEDLIDDLYLSMAILIDGHRVVQADDVVGLKTVAKQRKDEYARKVRIACQAFNVHKEIRPALRKQPLLIRYLYASHKTLRWTTIYSLIVAFVFAACALISAGFVVPLLWLSAVFAALLFLGYLNVRPFNRVIDVLLPLIANGMGIIESLRGKRYRTWASAASARSSL